MSTNQTDLKPLRRFRRERTCCQELLRLLPAILITTILVCILALLVGILCRPKSSSETIYPVQPEQLIPVIASLYENISGPAAFQQQRDHLDSKYYKMNDFFTMQNDENLVLLSNFKTYQQTSDYTAGCATAIMVLEYFGNNTLNESYCAEFTDTGSDINPKPNNSFGASPTAIEELIDIYGLETQSNQNFSVLPFSNYSSFASWVNETLNENSPIIVFSNSRIVNYTTIVGHYTVIIGYDTMGTNETYDDILIFADPYDTSDHRQDGYTVQSLERFYDMWSVPVTYADESFTQTFIIVSKPTQTPAE